MNKKNKKHAYTDTNTQKEIKNYMYKLRENMGKGATSQDCRCLAN